VTRAADARVALLKALAHPLRLRVVDRLAHTGPAPVSALAAELGVPMPELSNHLRTLREARVVRARRDGRRAIYELTDAAGVLPALLDRLVAPEAPAPRPGTPSRTCYGHLAGPLGVALYRGLCDAGALRPRRDGTIALGPAAAEALGTLGVDAAAVEPGRRRLAFECLDATEHAPHLAGALGDAVAQALLDCGWVRRRPPGRTVAVTATGERALATWTRER
jgi:DNA-binding transcriptional ArsR family regulator